VKAIVLTRFGGPDALEPQNLPSPVAGPREVVLEVRAVSVGRTLDVAARAGTLRMAALTPPHVLGAEHAGTVAEVGAAVTEVRPGDRVAVLPLVPCGRCRLCGERRTDACPDLEIIGIHRPGAYAERSVVPVEAVHRVPPHLSYAEAAAFALAGPLAWHQLSTAGVGPGSWVLIQAAGSALGSTTMQVARAMGARVIAASRTPDKRRRLAQLGADQTLDPLDAGALDAVQETTGGLGVDVVIDNIGDAALWALTVGALRRGGTIVSSGASAGATLELDLQALYVRCQRVVGLRTATAAAADAAWALATRRGLRPVLDAVFPLADAALAHERVERQANLGRVVLAVDPEAGQLGGVASGDDTGAVRPSALDIAEWAR